MLFIYVIYLEFETFRFTLFYVYKSMLNNLFLLIEKIAPIYLIEIGTKVKEWRFKHKWLVKTSKRKKKKKMHWDYDEGKINC